MKIYINETKFDIELNNTNFVDYWTSKIFELSNMHICSNTSFSNIQYSLNRFSEHKANLLNLLNEFNNIVLEYQFPDHLLYNIDTSCSSKFIEYVHEKWADYAKKANEKHLPIYDADIHEYDKAITAELKRRINLTSEDINPSVHKLEHLYLFFESNIQVNTSFRYGEYHITHEDSTFDTDNFLVSFWDIGRPQYEKWILCQNVDHEEISNYVYQSSNIEFRVNRFKSIPDERYINECNLKNKNIWGNKISIGNIKSINLYEIGFNVINSLTEQKNEIKFEL